jgi:hypothetical protein
MLSVDYGPADRFIQIEQSFGPDHRNGIIVAIGPEYVIARRMRRARQDVLDDVDVVQRPFAPSVPGVDGLIAEVANPDRKVRWKAVFTYIGVLVEVTLVKPLREDEVRRLCSELCHECVSCYDQVIKPVVDRDSGDGK